MQIICSLDHFEQRGLIIFDELDVPWANVFNAALFVVRVVGFLGILFVLLKTTKLTAFPNSMTNLTPLDYFAQDGSIHVYRQNWLVQRHAGFRILKHGGQLGGKTDHISVNF
jgi:hypothetical protein